jgi:hypothetical protein
MRPAIGPQKTRAEITVPQQKMPDWIPFEEGKYQVQQAYLLTATGRALMLETPFIQITTGRTGRKHLQGFSRARNIGVVELLEDTDALDILLDLGGEFTFLLEKPDIQAGKVFAPDVKSTLRFSPVIPWKPLSRAQFNNRLEQLNLMDRSIGSE